MRVPVRVLTISLAAVIAVSAFALTRNFSITKAEDTVRVRKNIASLSTEEIETLRKAIRVMRSKDASDPRSWQFQANMHGTYEQPPEDIQKLNLWNQCQHGTFYFLSWHRMYIYYFEKILREASGDEDFALPYWDYTHETGRTLPEAYRSPASESENPLFVSARNPQINQGYSLPPSAVLYDHAFPYKNFYSPEGSPLSFGGQYVDAPVHFTGPHGQIERQPHDIIHVLVGGQRGWMSDPNFAAQDPIFWSHHANIDRLWELWLEQGERENPVDVPPWAQTKFRFFDIDAGTNGDWIEVSAMDFINIEKAGYTYQSLEQNSARARLRPKKVATTLRALFEKAENPKAAIAMSRTEEEGFAVKNGATASFTLSETEKGQLGTTRAFTGLEDRTVLMVEDISFDAQPGTTFELYLNVPKDVKDSELSIRSPYYIGNLGFFGFGPGIKEKEEKKGDEHAHHHGGHVHSDKGAHAFDITDTIAVLKEAKKWNGSDVSVRFVERNLIAPKGATATSRGSYKDPNTRIGKFQLVQIPTVK